MNVTRVGVNVTRVGVNVTRVGVNVTRAVLSGGGLVLAEYIDVPVSRVISCVSAAREIACCHSAVSEVRPMPLCVHAM